MTPALSYALAVLFWSLTVLVWEVTLMLFLATFGGITLKTKSDRTITTERVP